MLINPKNILVPILFLCTLIHSCVLVNAKNALAVDRIGDVITPLAEETVISYRLPNNTRPVSYDVSLQTWIHEGNRTFIGHIDIVIQVLVNSSTATIHQRQLNITQIQLNVWDMYINCLWEYDPITEFVNIIFPIQLLENNTYMIKIDYTGMLRLDEAGFYISSYMNDNGETRYIATTQFESTDARHGYPCYDEPALKAIYKIRITHDHAYTAISNMPEVAKIPNSDGTLTTEFRSTPPTSSYLIAFIISDFSYNGNFYELHHRAFARSNAIHQTQLVLDSGIQILSALENFLGVNYSLPKMDQAAIPDFRAGAMENWGLVTYRETSFFFDPESTTYTQKLATVRVIAHEFVHQWFGNLVSPRWWTYLWLNEGFARWLSYLVTDLVHPDWRLEDYFIPAVMEPVMVTDASDLTRPMTYYVESPEAISRLFDNIAYEKSGCVLRMFAHVLSLETFTKGLNYYLIEKSYSDASQEDLFEGIQRAVNEDNMISDELNVATIMSSWSTQGGFPIIYAQRHYNEGTMTISQEKFLTYPTGTTSPTTFWIPISYSTANDTDFSDSYNVDHWLPQNIRFISIKQNGNRVWNSYDWIILNKQRAGYYRVLYDRRNWNLIANELNDGDFNRIDLLSRSQLIDDSFTFARSNRLHWDIPFEIIRYLRFENDYIPWASATNHLNYLNRFVTGLDNYNLYREFIANATELLFNYVGIEDIEDEPILSKYSRTLVINWSCTFGSTSCRDITNTRLRQLIDDGKEIHQNVKSVIYCAGLRNANENDYDYFYKRMLINEIDRTYLLSGLGCISNTTLLLEYLYNSINMQLAGNIRQGIFNGVFQNSREGYSIASQFLIDNFDNILTSFGYNNMGSTLTGISQRAQRKQDIDKVQMLIELANNKNITQTYINTMNTNILQNVQWSITHGNIIDEWLYNNFN